MKIAVVESGVVVHVIVAGDDMAVDLDGKAARGPATYTIESASGVREVAYEAVITAPAGGLLVASETVGEGWTYYDGVLTPPPPVPPTKDDLTAYAADTRWRKEIGGIVVGGVPVATDDRSKQMIIGARLAADADPDWTTQWVGADGAIYPINAAAIIAISDAVQANVNACFVAYAAVKSDIDAGDITTTQEIDDAFA